MAGVVGMPTLPEGYRFQLSEYGPYIQVRIEERHQKRWFGSEWSTVKTRCADYSDDPEQMATNLFTVAESLKRALMAELDKEKLIKEFNDSSN